MNAFELAQQSMTQYTRRFSNHLTKEHDLLFGCSSGCPGCHQTCYDSCTGGCSNTCWGGCEGNCYGGCSGNCYNACHIEEARKGRRLW